MDKKDKKKEDNFAEELIKSRTIIVSQGIDKELAQKFFNQVILLNQLSEKDPIYVYINSPGGCADSGFAMYDILKFIPNPVTTICSGICASAAVMVFLGADKDKNFSLPNSRFLLHQPSTGIQGTAADIQITAEEINKIRTKYNKIVSETTKKDLKKVTTDSKRDFWLSPKEAVKYGLVKKVINSKKEIIK